MYWWTVIDGTRLLITSKEVVDIGSTRRWSAHNKVGESGENFNFQNLRNAIWGILVEVLHYCRCYQTTLKGNYFEWPPLHSKMFRMPPLFEAIVFGLTPLKFHLFPLSHPPPQQTKGPLVCLDFWFIRLKEHFQFRKTQRLRCECFERRNKVQQDSSF